MRYFDFTYTAVAADLTGIDDGTVATGVGPWSFDIAPADGLAHKLTIRGNQATNHSAKTCIVAGKNANGAAQTETVNLPNGTATVTTTKYYLDGATTTFTISATIGADSMDIGWAVDAVSPWKQVAPENGEFGNMGVSCAITGTPTYSLQHSYDGTSAFDVTGIAAATTDKASSAVVPVRALRLLFAAAGGVLVSGLIT